MIEFELLEFAFAADAVHDLDLVVALGDVGDEGEEVQRLPVEAQRVQAPQRERGVADPGVAVVVVPLPTGGLRQRGRAGGRDGSGRGVGEALEGQRAALEEHPPRVIGELAPREPVLPVMGGPDLLLVGLLVAERRRRATPRQGDVAGVPLPEQGAGTGLAALETKPKITGQGELDIGALALRDGLVVTVIGVGPAHVLAPVVQHRLAVDHDLHLAGHAAHRPQEDVLGRVVVRRAPVVAGAGVVVVVPRTRSATRRGPRSSRSASPSWSR